MVMVRVELNGKNHSLAYPVLGTCEPFYSFLDKGRYRNITPNMPSWNEVEPTDGIVGR